MKKSILTMVLLALMVGTISTSLGQNAEKKSVIASQNIQDNLNALEKKNDDLKKKLTDFTSKDPKDGTSFKIEFNHELDELGKAVKDFTIKYNK